MFHASKRTLVRIACASVLGVVLLGSCSLRAQIAGTGSIEGTVSDPSGAIIPGARVEATNAATAVKTTRLTTAVGYYVIASLAPGDYNVRVSANGFQSLVREHVIVDALTTTSLNPTLKVGSSTDQVTVTDALPTLNTSDASMSQTVRNDVYTSLPLTMGTGGASINSPRDPTAFVALMPGVTGYGSNTAGSVAGGRPASEEVYVDGMSTTSAVLQGEVRYLSLGITIEAVDQFQLQSAGQSVMYSGQGSTNFVLKSGTNQFHGTLYENLRNSDLDARGFFPAVRPVNKQNEFGGTFSGPIRRNRIFFFGSYGGYRTKQSTTPTYISLPTLLQRAGNFSELPTQIYDPLTTVCSGGSCARQVFPGNLIPANRIAAPSSFFQSFLPAPSNSAIQSNYLGSEPVGFAVNNTTEKADLNVTEKHRLSVSYTRGKRGQTTIYRNGNIPLPYTDSRVVTEVMSTGQIRETFLATSSMLNQVSIGFSRFWVPIEDGTMISTCGDGGGGVLPGVGKYCGNWMPSGGVKGLPGGAAAGAFPYMTFSGANSPFSWRNGNSPAFNEAMNNINVQDNVQYTRGRHSITVGMQLQWLQANEKAATYGSFATWTFSNTQTAGFSPAGTILSATGNSYASYLLGALSSSTVTDAWNIETGARFRNYSWWVQDNIKVTPRLTLNLGLRHDLQTPWVEVLDRMSWLNPTMPNPAIGGFPGALEFAGHGPDSCHCRTNIGMYRKNFQPRVGFAYSINNKTVVRAGYSLMSARYGAVGGGGTKDGTGTLGFVATPSFTSLDNGITPAFYWQDGVPAYQKAPFFDPTLNTGFTTTTPQGGSITYGDPILGPRPPRYLNWNISLQREIVPTVVLEVSYLGSLGHRLPGGALGWWSDQIQTQYLALKNVLNASATAANLASARALFPAVALPYGNYSGPISQMLRPFPQYSGVTVRYADLGNSNYNSLQVVASKSSRGFTVNFNYTFMKSFDDLGSQTGYQGLKAQSTNPSHVLNALWVYQLPLGKNHKGTLGSRVAASFIRNWQVSGITTYRSGAGLGSIGAACTLPNAGTCFASYNPAFSGPVRINGGYGSGNLLGANTTAFLDVNAFVSPPAYSYGDTPRTLVYGLRGPGFFNQNFSLRRQFFLREWLKLTFQADSLNVLNSVSFSNPAISITSATFGRITSQANTPRNLQFSARITF